MAYYEKSTQASVVRPFPYFQMLPEYVNEIYGYMRQLEVRQSVQANYLSTPENVKGAIKPRMRNFLVDWLVEVHQQFSLIQETLYLTVAILDRCENKSTIRGTDSCL